MTDLQIDRKRSVTRGDQLDGTNGGVFVWQLYDGAPRQPNGLPGWWEPQRDAVLSATLDLEDMWASAVNQAITKFASRNFDVNDSDDSTRRTTYGQELLLDFDGPAQYTTAIARHLQDFLLCDNGAFIEIERAAAAPGSRPVALWHLDSARCRRTGNNRYPVVYVGFDGVERALRYDQVLMISDMPSPRVGLWGVGRCAASRAWHTIIKLAAVETYFREKITGSGALALHFVSGVNTKQLEDVMQTSEIERENKRHFVYKGAVVVPVLGDRDVTVATVDLASVPDRFEVSEERRGAYLRYANAIGIPVQDIQPLSGQGLGTGKQTEILDDAANDKGLAFWRVWFERTINRRVLPKTTTFSFGTNDLRDQKAKAEIALLRAQARAAQITSGEITPMQALNMAVDAKDVPQEFLPTDMTAGGVLSDTGLNSKPVAIDPAMTSQADAALQQLASGVSVTKAKRLTVADLDEDAAIAGAEKLFDEVKGSNATERP